MGFNRDNACRRSIRLRHFDYSAAGAYFVTICTFERECLFGDVADGMMRLNGLGEIVRDEWLRTPSIRPNVELDGFVVMPNHLHGILFIHDVGAHRCAPGSGIAGPEIRAHIGAPLRRQSNSVGSIVAGFKSAATKRVNLLRDNPGGSVWQRNYHERVIRDDRELDGVRHYVANNPARWDDDENHPAMLTP